MPMRVLIADDDPEASSYLKSIIEDVMDVAVVGVAQDGKDAVDQAEANHPHVVFLDIDMPEMNGVEVARVLSDLQPDLIFVFATGHADYWREAFELYTYDYILKPFDEQRIRRTVRRLRDRVFNDQVRKAKENQSIMIQIDERRVFLDPDEIIFIECQKPKLLIKTVNKNYLTVGDMVRMEEKMNPVKFFRSHKSYLVNLRYLKEIMPSGRTFEILLSTGDKILLSRNRERVLRDRFGI